MDRPSDHSQWKIFTTITKKNISKCPRFYAILDVLHLHIQILDNKHWRNHTSLLFLYLWSTHVPVSCPTPIHSLCPYIDALYILYMYVYIHVQLLTHKYIQIILAIFLLYPGLSVWKLCNCVRIMSFSYPILVYVLHCLALNSLA